MDKFLVSNLGAFLEYIRRKLKVIYTVRFIVSLIQSVD